MEQALFTRPRRNAASTATGLVHPSDAGSQYTSLPFTQAPLEAGMAGSIGSVGGALHNALMESTLGLCRTELIDRQRSRTDGPRSSRRPPPGSAGSTPTDCTPRSATGRPWSSETSTVPPRPLRPSRWPEPSVPHIQDSSRLRNSGQGRGRRASCLPPQCSIRARGRCQPCASGSISGCTASRDSPRGHARQRPGTAGRREGPQLPTD
jgi:hypothetical protein